jgi:molybdenum cofactor synthesis domain-containing protein
MMRPLRETIPFDNAVAVVLEAAVPVERIERVALEDANGRVIAETVVAGADVPPFDRAAMDGFALIAEETSGATRTEAKHLVCVEAVYTGQMPSRAIGPGECMEIATGAPVPDGASAVVMVEETARDADGAIRVLTPVTPGQNIGRRGSDIRQGAAVIEAGTELSPSRVGAVAATGTAEVEVFAKPVVAILSTGNEIVEPGAPLRPGQIYDINRYTLSAVVAAHGGIPLVLPPAPDNLEDLTVAVNRAAASADIIVFSGGSSVGEKDLIVDVLRAKGEVLFHGISVKPGKPTIFGKVRGTPFLGMPGNPTSCLSNAYLLLVPLLRSTARLPAHQPSTVRLPLSRRVVSTSGRHQFYTVRILDNSAAPAFKASGDITSMSRADGYFEIPAHVDSVEAGEMVDVKRFQ